MPFLHHDFVEEEREQGLLHLGADASEKLVVSGAGGHYFLQFGSGIALGPCGVVCLSPLGGDAVLDTGLVGGYP